MITSKESEFLAVFKVVLSEGVQAVLKNKGGYTKC